MTLHHMISLCVGPVYTIPHPVQSNTTRKYTKYNNTSVTVYSVNVGRALLVLFQERKNCIYMQRRWGNIIYTYSGSSAICVELIALEREYTYTFIS